MKKATLKLGIRIETLRVLGVLDLVRAAAGGPAVRVMDTGGDNRTCVAQALADTGTGVKA
ncbi:MAG: hypothetical protein ABIY55_11275 [Kofleriaceae bacterium]